MSGNLNVQTSVRVLNKRAVSKRKVQVSKISCEDTY